jgi:hypothetical protein
MLMIMSIEDRKDLAIGHLQIAFGFLRENTLRFHAG